MSHDPPYRAAPEDGPEGREMEAEFRAAREAAERQFRIYRQQIAEELARNVADTFSSTPTVPGRTPQLEQVPVVDLHRLEQADSRVRHSIVQTCFYNLRLYSALLPDRHDRVAFRAKLQRNLAQLPTIGEELRQYFGAMVGGVPLGEFFPAERSEVLEELQRLTVLAEEVERNYDDPAARGRFAREAPGHIDRVMAALGRITERLRGVKVDLVGLLDEVVALHGDRLAEAGISLRFSNEDGETAPIFGRRRDLMNAFGELIANAARHGLADLPPGRERLVAIVLRLVSLGQQTYQIDFADTGRGMPPEIRRRLGAVGITSGGTGFGFAMVRRIIEEDHLGTVAVLSRPGRGTLVRIHLPRTLARTL